MRNRFLELTLCAALAAGATWILTPRAVQAGASPNTRSFSKLSALPISQLTTNH